MGSGQNGRGGPGVATITHRRSSGDRRGGRNDPPYIEGLTIDDKDAPRRALNHILSGRGANRVIRERIHSFINHGEAIPDELIKTACGLAHEKHKKKLREVLKKWSATFEI